MRESNTSTRTISKFSLFPILSRERFKKNENPILHFQNVLILLILIFFFFLILATNRLILAEKLVRFFFFLN
jgi:hypothetical protein